MDMGEVARRLRADDQLSIAQIRELLGVSREQIEDWLRGVPVPEWTKRPNAKDDLRARAVDLRNAGYSVPGIARELGIARSTAWLWTKHIPLADDTPEAHRRRQHAKRMNDARWDRHRVERDEHRRLLDAEATARIGGLDERDLLILGAVMYWCEGTKSKPWRQVGRVEFVTSDPRLVRLFLLFLDAMKVERSDLSFRVQIHETADAAAAVAWWAETVDARPEDFHATNIKRHNPKTNRQNQGVEYHGCLRIGVCHSRGLYRTIESVIDALSGPADAVDGGAR